jgi:hypothetical protein
MCERRSSPRALSLGAAPRGPGNIRPSVRLSPGWSATGPQCLVARPVTAATDVAALAALLLTQLNHRVFRRVGSVFFCHESEFASFRRTSSTVPARHRKKAAPSSVPHPAVPKRDLGDQLRTSPSRRFGLLLDPGRVGVVAMAILTAVHSQRADLLARLDGARRNHVSRLQGANHWRPPYGPPPRLHPPKRLATKTPPC